MGVMTRTEAAEIIALRLRVTSRRAGSIPTLHRAEELVSEARGGHLGDYLKECADLANPKTVARLAKAGM
jgi:hypothetical protein